MSRKKGDLPGRYVLPYVRRLPNQPNEYGNVIGYQERVEPLPSPLEPVPPQRELNLQVAPTSMPKKLPNPVDKHVGSRVRMRRMMLDMSQTALGDALGITFQQVQKYEKGTNRISASRLQNICSILQVPVAFFFDGAPHVAAERSSSHRPSTADELTDFMTTRDGLALVKAFMRIGNVRVRQRIVDLIEQIDETKR